MKYCSNCGAELPDGARFCSKCGKTLSKDSENINTRKEPKVNKKAIYAFLAVIGVLLLIVFGSMYYSDYSEKEKAVESESIAVVDNDMDSKSLKSELEKALKVVVKDYDKSYFTDGFNDFYKRGCEKAEKENIESPRVWWQYSDSDPEDFKIKSVTKTTENEGNAIVTIIGELYQVDFNVQLKNIGGRWLIDEISEINGSQTDIGYESVLSERKLSESDLYYRTKKELEIMRNSIYARYGYRFKRDDLFNHFSQYSWYNPTTSDMLAVYNSMSDIERYNVDFIKKHE